MLGVEEWVRWMHGGAAVARQAFATRADDHRRSPVALAAPFASILPKRSYQ